MEARWYQDEAINATLSYLDTQVGNPIIALPTGTGKGFVIAEFLRRVFASWHDLRVIMATHVETLVEQNHVKFLQVWPTAPVGIYCAGLKQKQFMNPIVFGTIASIAKDPFKFGKRNLFIIDEAHLLSPNDDSMYQKTIAELKKINPNMRVMGLTATAYRLKQGGLTENGLFTDVVYDLTDFAGFERLRNDGFICPLVSRPMETEFDLSGVDKVAGEWAQNQLQKAVDKTDIIEKCVRETLQYRGVRNSWFCFATGVDHTEHVAEIFQSYDVPMLAYHSKLSKQQIKDRMGAFKAGEIAGLVSANMLTTGIDHEPLDYIIDMQPTLSPNKHVQKLGRGTRPWNYMTSRNEWLATRFPYIKNNCLVSDFARNVQNNGPINDPRIPNAPGQKRPGTVPVKICMDRKVKGKKITGCIFYNHTTARECEQCGEPFDFGPKLTQQSYAGEPMRLNPKEEIKSQQPVIAEFDVDTVFYTRHEKRDKTSGNLLTPPSMKVIYACGMREFHEFVFFESEKPRARHEANEWWRQRHHGEPPVTVSDALKYVKSYRIPRQIKVQMNSDYPKVVGYVY